MTDQIGGRSLGDRVLVTGAAGFIGSHLVEAVAGGGTAVRAFVRYNSRNDYGWLESLPAALLEDVEIFRGDLANPEAVANAVAGCDTVFHLGALIPIPYSYRHPREFVTANVEGTLFFRANDGSHGYELWALQPAPAAVGFGVSGFPLPVPAGTTGGKGGRNRLRPRSCLVPSALYGVLRTFTKHQVLSS